MRSWSPSLSWRGRRLHRRRTTLAATASIGIFGQSTMVSRDVKYNIGGERSQLTMIMYSQRFGHELRVFLRRRFTGPLLLGLVIGGLPIGVVFSRLTGRPISTEILRFIVDLTPIAISVAVLGAILTRGDSWRSLWRGAFVASLAACVPLPTLACTVLTRLNLGTFALENVPLLVFLFALWATAVAIPSWLLAATYTVFRRHRAMAISQFNQG